jgi:HK97 family phage major capsid protein
LVESALIPPCQDSQRNEGTGARLANPSAVVVKKEAAVLIPIPEAVIDDASYDVWGELRDPIAQAIGVKLDAAIFAGTENPASWPQAIIPAAVAAGNTNTIDATPAEGGIYTDILEPATTLRTTATKSPVTH